MGPVPGFVNRADSYHLLVVFQEEFLDGQNNIGCSCLVNIIERKQFYKLDSLKEVQKKRYNQFVGIYISLKRKHYKSDIL